MIDVAATSKATREWLVRMKAESPENIGVDLDGEPAVPAAVVSRTACQAEADLVASKRHPVDPAIMQSNADDGHGLP